MKKIRFALITVMLLAALLAFAACGVDKIALNETDAPRTTYVKGQELDRSVGTLVVTSGKKTEEIPLSDEGVEIAGYDKDKTGKQELTVSYEEQTVTYTVNVVERFVGEGIETEYLVGESLNRARGQVRITKDDGTSFVVPFSDPALAVEFDATAAGAPLSVPVRYSGENGSFSGTIAVNVYTPESATFTRPTKTSYKSHEDVLELAGGYFTFVANSGRLTRYIQLTPDMAEGFDVTQATLANRTTPLEQVITLTYLGQTSRYTIRITFSDVSVIRLRAKECAGVDWSASPAPDAERCANAVEAMQLYFGLADDEKALVSHEDALSVARAAAYYGLAEWKKAADEYKDTFTADSGTLTYTEGHYDAAKADYLRLQDNTQPLYTLGSVLAKIRKQFGEELLFGTQQIGGYLEDVFDPSGFPKEIEKLGFMLSLYETLKDIPADWAEDHSRLKTYADKLDQALGYISDNKYSDITDRPIFGVVASWREAGDFFEMLYWFNLERYLSDNQTEVRQGAEALSALIQRYLPGPLEELYNCCNLAYSFMTGMANQQILDSTYFMLYYDRAVDLVDEVFASEDELYAALYELVDFDSILSTIRMEQYGYFYQSDALLGDEEFESIWQRYIALFNRLLSDEDYPGSQQFGSDIQSLFAQYLALSPAKQFGFISSVNVFYRQDIPAYAWDTAEGAYSYFVSLIVSYYSNELSEAGAELFKELLLVLENYSLRSFKEDANDLFLAGMQSAQVAYRALPSADKAQFDRLAGGLYTKCKEAYDYALSLRRPDLGEWEDKFEELAITLDEVYAAYLFIQEGYPLYTPLLAAYEKAESLNREILSSGNEDVLDAYEREEFTFGYLGKCTFDLAFYNCRGVFSAVLTKVTLQDLPLYDYYEAYQMKDFLKAAEPVYWEVLGAADEDTLFLSAESVKAVTAAFRAMSPEAQTFFLAIDAYTAGSGDETFTSNWYYDSLIAILADLFEEDADPNSQKNKVKETAIEFLYNLFDLEQVYAYYLANPTGTFGDGTTYAAYAKSLAEELRATYIKPEFTLSCASVLNPYLKDTYDFYISACANLK